MARRASSTGIIEPDLTDPVDDVVRDDRFTTATELSDVIGTLSGYDAGSIRGVLYRIPNGGGKYETIETIYPPFNPDAMIEDLKERFGGGDYQLRIMETGKPGVKKNINFSIAKERPSLLTHEKKNDDNSMMMMMFQMMMKQSEDAARQRADDMRDRQAAAERQLTMVVGLATAAIPALVGGKEKTSDLMLAIGSLIPKPDPAPQTSMKETMETLTLMKGFVTPEKEAEGPEAMIHAVGSVAGPAMKALGDMFSGRKVPGQPPQLAAPVFENNGQQEDTASPPALVLPAPQSTPQPPLEGPAPGPSRWPVLDLIRDDVMFLFRRNHDPEKAADLVYDTIEAHDVSEDDINAMVSAFTFSADPLGDLAGEGIDIRSRPEWAQQFFAAIVSIHADVDRTDNDSGRGDGSAADVDEDGDAGKERAA